MLTIVLLSNSPCTTLLSLEPLPITTTMAVDFNHHISLSSLFLVCHHSHSPLFPMSLLSLLVADESQLLAERDNALHDLLLHEVEAHGEHGHPEEDVHEAEQELGRNSFNRKDFV